MKKFISNAVHSAGASGVLTAVGSGRSFILGPEVSLALSRVSGQDTRPKQMAAAHAHSNSHFLENRSLTMEEAENQAPDPPQQPTDHTSQQPAWSTSAWPRSSLWPTFFPRVSMRVLSCIMLVSLAPSAPLSPALAMLAPKRHLAAAVIPRPLPLLVSSVAPLPELKTLPSSEPLLGLPGACSSASSVGMRKGHVQSS